MGGPFDVTSNTIGPYFLLTSELDVFISLIYKSENNVFQTMTKIEFNSK